jgi:hypothetical protein
MCLLLPPPETVAETNHQLRNAETDFPKFIYLSFQRKYFYLWQVTYIHRELCDIFSYTSAVYVQYNGPPTTPTESNLLYASHVTKWLTVEDRIQHFKLFLFILT